LSLQSRAFDAQYQDSMRAGLNRAVWNLEQYKTWIVAHNRSNAGQSCHLVTQQRRGIRRLMKSNYSNTAQLKDLMTVPPMTAAQHAEVMRKRIQHRRMVEEAKEMKKADSWNFDKR
jgi:ketol-acid reductoisomerase